MPYVTAFASVHASLSEAASASYCPQQPWPPVIFAAVPFPLPPISLFDHHLRSFQLPPTYMSDNLRIPSFYFSKAGSAASWYVKTDTELRSLAAGLVGISSSTTILEESAETVTLRGIDDVYRSPNSPTQSLEQSTFFPRIYTECTCTCHGPSRHGHYGHDHGHLAAPHVIMPGSSDAASITRHSVSIYSVHSDTGNDNSPVSMPVSAAIVTRLLPIGQVTSTAALKTLSGAEQPSGKARTSYTQAMGRLRFSKWWTRSPSTSTVSLSESESLPPLSPSSVSKPSPTRPRRPSIGPEVPEVPPIYHSRVVKKKTGLISPIGSPAFQTRFVLPSIQSPPSAYTRRPASSEIGVAL